MTREERQRKMQEVSEGVTRLAAERDEARTAADAALGALDETLEAVHATVLAASPPPEPAEDVQPAA